MRNHSTKTRAQIADEYGVSPRTLRGWLKRGNIQITAGLLSPKDQARIYEALGHPERNHATNGGSYCGSSTLDLFCPLLSAFVRFLRRTAGGFLRLFKPEPVAFCPGF